MELFTRKIRDILNTVALAPLLFGIEIWKEYATMEMRKSEQICIGLQKAFRAYLKIRRAPIVPQIFVKLGGFPQAGCRPARETDAI